jgi:hypothetical protein
MYSGMFGGMKCIIELYLCNTIFDHMVDSILFFFT